MCEPKEDTSYRDDLLSLSAQLLSLRICDGQRPTGKQRQEAIEDAKALISDVDAVCRTGAYKPLSTETLSYLNWLVKHGPDREHDQHSFGHERRALVKAGLGHYGSNGEFRPTAAGVERCGGAVCGIELAGQEDAA
jgi:hypothetical protein